MSKYIFHLNIIFLVFLSACSGKKKNEIAKIQDSVYTATINDSITRTSITFILGSDDEHRDNPYYSLANHYYRINPSEKTEIVVDTIRSLLEIRNYLENHRPKNGLPWGRINLVSHGNEFIDLSVKVVPNGNRTSVESLQQAFKENIFKPLDTAIIDSISLIHLHACGIGNNQPLLNALAKAFGCEYNRAPLKASKVFEYYAYTSNNRNPQSIRHYYAKVWYAFFNPEYEIEPDTLITQLQKRYPAAKMNWREAIARKYQQNPSQVYHIILGVPVVWDDVYESEEKRPILGIDEDHLHWLGRQKGYYRLIRKTKVPEQYFDVKFLEVTLRSVNGKVHYSLRVKAKANIMCLIKPLLQEEQEEYKQYEPFIPETNDSTIFGFAGK